ncbi:MAG: hypothetical protein KAI66_09240 [Lentisphaeria bacterium]|nr:hypothetical protein [Lentisphaeria bacterium]
MTTDRISALLTLLQDEDTAIAALAMEEFLRLGGAADETIAEHQEANDPQLRRRIHQLSGIVSRRRERDKFVKAVTEQNGSLWEYVVEMNCLYDSGCNRSLQEQECNAISDALSGKPVGASSIASTMRERDYTVPTEDIIDVDLFLVAQVTESRYGSAPLLCALAQEAGDRQGWESTIVLHGGRFCLFDREHLLLDPTQGWHLAKLGTEERIHPCSRKDVVLAVLCQLFLASLIEGHLRELHHFGTLLTTLNGDSLDTLPFPLGTADPLR